jgi:hypothetical protein
MMHHLRGSISLALLLLAALWTGSSVDGKLLGAKL